MGYRVVPTDAAWGWVAMRDPVAPLQMGEIAGAGLLFIIGGLFLLVLLAVVVFVLAQRLEERVEWLSARMDLGEAVLETPLGVVFESAEEFDTVLGVLARYFVYLAGLLIAVGLSGIRALTGPVEAAARYVPSLVGAVLILVVGFVVAGYVARSVKASDLLGGKPLSNLVATTFQVFIYFVVVTLALDALGYSTAILTTLAQAIAVGVGLGLALAIGISVGLGAQDYVGDNIERWVDE